MKTLKSALLAAFLGSILFATLAAFQSPPPALAQVTRTGDGFKYSGINHAIIQKNLKNGFKVVDVDFHYLDSTFYLVRKVKGPDNKTGYLFSEVKRVKNQLYPIKKIELYFACWQIASCQCERPSKYAACSCNGGPGTDSCATDQGPALWDDFYQVIFHI